MAVGEFTMNDVEEKLKESPSKSGTGSEAAFALIEALEAEPHLGMTESHDIWDAYSNLARALGGKPMRKWWKRTAASSSRLRRFQ